MIVAAVRRTIVARKLISQSGTVLIACSGGPDSVVLTHVLHRLRSEFGLQLVVASIDHGLRADAHKDVATAREVAAALGLPFHPLRVSVPRGASVQSNARQLRYESLRQLASTLSATRIAVGHTMDDQAETVLHRLIRGSSIEGLSGIAPKREDGVIRPLIDCRRKDVHAYLRDFHLPCVHDPSNEHERFFRARARRVLLPALTAENPALIEHLAAVADDARAASRLLRKKGRQVFHRSRIGAHHLDGNVLLEAGRAARRSALKHWARTELSVALSRAHLEELDHGMESGRGDVRLPDGWSVHIDSERQLMARSFRKYSD